jgi:chemotaxis family two-component system sensor kinase Cph1
MDEVTLENCDLEPIHIPGLVQPRGALMALNKAGTLCFFSENSVDLLGVVCTPGNPIDAQQLPALILEKILLWLADSSRSFECFDVLINHTTFDVLGHWNSDGLLIVEFESSSQPNSAANTVFAMAVQKAMERFRRQENLHELLGIAVDEVRSLTGFDRVMAYRFRHDDSGEVVRESRRDGLDSWEGQRYPSSDIPAQARRLYILNTLRLIADVNARPVAIVSAAKLKLPPLDMSFCALRSVSPIHIEYLSNMGVAASLSISLVVNGKLWGMIACHHSKARHVSHGIRMACEILGQLLSVTIGSLLMAETAQRVKQSTATLAAIGVRARAADDLLAGIVGHRPNPHELIAADLTLCIWGGRFEVCSGQMAPESISGLAEALGATAQEIVHSERLQRDFPALALAAEPFCGMMAICFDVSRRGWIVWLRFEQIENVRWAGEPHKRIKSGPKGPRLTPRGSFLEWQQEVRGSSIPWDDSDLATAEAFRAELSQIAGTHAIEMERARHQLLAALGHDLRDPLYSISIAAQILQRQTGPAVTIGARIEATSGRMSRLVTQILDMSLLQSSAGMELKRASFELCELLKESVSETQFSYPGIDITTDATEPIIVSADRDRLSLVLSNLLSNARHHGSPGKPVIVFGRRFDDRVQFGTINSGSPIPEDITADLFKAFKPGMVSNPRNRTGLGLGLYIAAEVMKAHGGTLEFACESDLITFTASLPTAFVMS